MQKQSSSGIASVDQDGAVDGLTPPSPRRRILDAMIASCGEKTYSETTIGDLAARAAVSRTTFYGLFADKRDCFDAAVTDCIDRVATRLTEAASEHEDPADATRAASLAGLEMIAAEPALALILGGDVVVIDPGAIDRYAEMIARNLEAIWAGAGGASRKHISPGLAIGRAQLLVFHEVAVGRATRLPELLPNLVYLAVATFAGHDEGIRQARLAAEPQVEVGV